MKKSRLISLILSLCLIVSIVGTTIDWSFLDAFAEADETVIVPEDVPETISENEVLENGDEESLLEEEALPEDPVSELDAEADGLHAVYTYEAGFMPGSVGIIEKLSEEEAGKLAIALSEGMSGRTAVPVCGFKLDVQADGFTAADFVHVKISGLGDGQELYRFEDTFEKVEFEKDEEDGITFEAALPGTYLFINMEYDEEPLTFSYSDDEVTVTAVCLAESGIPEDAALAVRKIEEGTDEYKDAYDKVLASMDLKEGETLKFAPYDVSFVKDGQEIEPSNGTVSVKMEFAEDPIKANPEDEVLGDVFYVHVKDNGSVEALDAAVKETGADFEVASFSIMAAAAVSTNAEEAAYAILYSDGSLVFQRGPEADTEHGDVVGSWTGFETQTTMNSSYMPWYDNRLSVTSVIFKDSISPYLMVSWFYGFKNCTSFDLALLDTSHVTSMELLFNNCENLASLDLSNFETSSVINMRNMFNGCKSLAALDLSNFKTQNVTNMERMFDTCKSLASLDLSAFDTSSVTTMYGMFYSCESLVSLNLSSFNTQNVTNMYWMFDGCSSLASLDLSTFNTSSVTTMYCMFGDCKSLTELDLSSFDTSSVTNMYWMFRQCKNLTTLDLSNFDTSSVTDMNGMFSQCNKLETLDLSNFDTSSVTDMNSMFDYCYALKDLDLSNFNTCKVRDMSYMFSYCRGLETLNISSFDTSSVTRMAYMFRGCECLSELSISNFNTSSVTRMAGMFTECNRLTSLDVSSFITSNVTDMYHMFYGCYELIELDLSNFDTHSVTNMNNMFGWCRKLISLDLSNFDTCSVTNMGSMFNSCYDLIELNLSGFNTSSVTDMQSMFSNCRSLKKLDLSSFDTSMVIDMSQMFLGCNNLTELDLSHFNTSKVTGMVSLFMSCTNLKSLNLSSFDTSKVNNLSEMFYNCKKLQYLDLSGFNTSSLIGTTSTSRMFYQCDDLLRIDIGSGIDNPIFFSSDIFQLPWASVDTGVIYDNFAESYVAGMTGTYAKAIDIMFDSLYCGKHYVKSYIGAHLNELPVDPNADHRHFNGWFTEKNGGVKLLPGGILESDIYYAHYTDYQYILTLDPNGGTGNVIVQTLNYHDPHKLPGAVYDWHGKVFAGWNTRKDGSGTTYGVNDYVRGLVSEDGGSITLYAQYADPDNMVTITFDTDGGMPIEPIHDSAGSVVRFPEASKKGYHFQNWRREDGSTIAAGTNFVLENDETLYANYVKNPIVTFDTQGVVSTNQQRTVDYGSTIGPLPSYPPYSLRYMSLIGWFTEPDGGELVKESRGIMKDVTFYAHWGWLPRFNTNGGRIVSDETFPIQEGSSVYNIPKLPDIERQGYTFEGWYLADGITKLEDGCSIDLSNGVDIDAKWKKADSVEVSFDPNGGYILNSKNIYELTYIKGQPFEMFPPVTAPSKSVPGFGTAYSTFLGWRDSSGNLYTESDCPECDLKLTAQWIDPSILLTFDADGGSTVGGTGVSQSKMCVTLGSTLNSLPGTKKTGYIFDGWYTERNGGGEKLTTDTVIISPATYYANWTPFFLNASDDAAKYVYGAEWSNSSGSDASNHGDQLEFHPTGNGKVSASLHIRFELTKAIGDDVLPAGSIKIRVPKRIWKDWDGNFTGTDNMAALLPEYPQQKDGSYFAYMEDGDDYVIINSSELSGSAGADFTIQYQVSPVDVPGGASNMNGRYLPEYEFYSTDVPVSFAVDSDLDGSPESQAGKTLSVEMHTMGSLNGYYSYNITINKWDNRWGDEPADADRYFYNGVAVYVQTPGGSQPFSEIELLPSVTDPASLVHVTNFPYTDEYCYGNYYYWCPMSAVAEAPSSGLKIEYSAFIKGTLKSGYTIFVPTATKIDTITKPSFGLGSLTKYHTSANTSTPISINDGQETILDDGKPVELSWYVGYRGSSPGTPGWNDEIGTYSVKERSVRIQDGLPGDILYSSGNAASPYIWDPDTGNIMLEDDDYYYSQIRVYLNEYDARFADGTWSKTTLNDHKDEWNHPQLYVRYAGSDTFVWYADLPGTTTIDFNPSEKIVGIEVRHSSDYFETSLSVYGDIQLKPTNHVKMLLQDDVDQGVKSVIKNSAHLDAWLTEEGEDHKYLSVINNLGGSNPAGQYCYNLGISKTNLVIDSRSSEQESTSFDVTAGTQDTPMYISARNYNNGGSRKKRMDKGTFYTLLPAGASVDPGTVFGIPITTNTDVLWKTSADETLNSPDNYENLKNDSRKIDKGYYDVRMVPNWENSGRTMMIIKYGLPDSYEVSTGMGFYYLLHNTYENIMEHGTSVECDTAFVNETDSRVPYNAISGGLDDISEKGYFQSLNDDHNGSIGYGRADTNYVPVDSYSWGFHTSVQTVSEYEREGETLLNGLYTYRLAYSQSEYTQSSDLVFYDVLENGFDEKGDNVHRESDWHGTLEYVNASSAEEKLTDGSESIYCKPVVYYSTKSRDSITESDFNISNTAVWSTEKPADLSTVTAVAVDCSKNEDGSDFVMKGQQSLEIYIGMRASKNAEYADKIAYNEGVVSARHGDDEAATLEYSNASVVLRNVEPEFHKAANPEGGAEESPAEVYIDDELTYTLSLTNPSGTFTLNDAVIEDTVPAGLNVDASNIMVHFGNPETALKISVSPRAEMTKSGQKLTFTVSSLLSGETIYLEIPSVVRVATGTLANTAVLKSVNDVEKNLNSDTTWHIAAPAVMSVRKTGALNKGLSGASLQLLDESGNLVHEWISNGLTEHVDLPAGTYTVHEVSAPSGYLPVGDIKVNLSRNGVLTLEDGTVVSPVIMQDDWTKIKIETQDPDGNPQPGCETVIYKTEDVIDGVPVNGAEPVARWTSEEDPYEILGKLEAGNSYVVIEESVPEEFMPGKPVTFTVAEDGSEQTIVIQSTKKGTEVMFRKVDEIGNALSGAELKVSTVVTEEVSEAESQSLDILTNRMGDDAAGLNNTNAAVDESFTSGAEPYTLLLEPGDYVFHEENAPLGYAVAADIYFTVTEDGKIMIGSEEVSEVVMTDNMEFHTLSVIKVVKGSMGDKTKKFKFRLTLTASDMEGLPSSEIPETTYLPYILSTANASNPRNDTGIMPVIAGGDSDDQPANTLLLTNGVCEFELAHGETILFDLPYGIGYKVEELDAAGYEVESEGAEGMIGNADAAASFTNTKNGTVATGFKASTGLTVGFGILSGLLALALVLYRLKLHWKKK